MATDPTYAATVAEFSAFALNANNFYANLNTLFTGVATYTTTTPAGQPGPGYYPNTDPQTGVVTWFPCLDLIKATANTFKVVTSAIVNRQMVAADSNTCIRLLNTGGTTNVTVTFPTGLPIGWNCIFLWSGTQTLTRFVGASGVTIEQDQSLASMRAKFSVVMAVVEDTNKIILSGSMIA